MCSKVLHFDGNVLTPSTNHSRALQRRILIAQKFALDHFHGRPEPQPVDFDDRKTDGPKFMEYLYARASLEGRFKRKIADRSEIIFGLYSYLNVEYRRGIYVPWAESKTDIELVAHCIGHLIPAPLFSLGIPTYDLALMNSVSASAAMRFGARIIRDLIEAEVVTDGKNPFSFCVIEGMLRTLRVIDGYVPGSFGGDLPSVSVSLTQPLVLTPLEAAEATIFQKHLSAAGLPNVEITLDSIRKGDREIVFL